MYTNYKINSKVEIVFYVEKLADTTEAIQIMIFNGEKIYFATLLAFVGAINKSLLLRRYRYNVESIQSGLFDY